MLSKPKPSNPRIDFEADDTTVLTTQSYEKMTHGQKGTSLPLPIAPALSAMLPIAPALPIRERETRERETREKRNQRKYEPKPKNKNRPIKEEQKKPTEDGEIIDKNSK